MELLGERWTVLVVSRLLDGCRRFNEIHRGVPRMSASLLSTRLGQLENAGLCEKVISDDGKSTEYWPTDACRDLEGIVMDLAAWGQKWARDLERDDLDPAFLAWSMSTRLDISAMPKENLVIEFEFIGLSREFKRFWLMKKDNKIEMCVKHPGFESDVKVMSKIRDFVDVWRGFRPLSEALRSNDIRITGPKSYVTDLPNWLMLSSLASVPRLRPGREQKISQKHQ